MEAEIDTADPLFANARLLTGIDDYSTLVNEALKALVEREELREGSSSGGSDPSGGLPSR